VLILVCVSVGVGGVCWVVDSFSGYGEVFTRVEHFAILEKLVPATTSRILRILMEHVEIKNSLDSKLQIFSICSVRIRNNPEVMAKRRLSQSRKMLNPSVNGVM